MMDFSQEKKVQNSPNPDLDQDLFKASFKKFKSWKNLDFILPLHKSKEIELNCSGSSPTSTTITEDTSRVTKSEALQLLLDPTMGLSTMEPSFEEWDKLLQKRCLVSDATLMDKCDRLGLGPLSTWRVFELSFPRGLILIRNPFTPKGQRYWMKRSVMDFTKCQHHITNIDNLEYKEGKSIQDKQLGREEFFKKLRWVTFGYHHNWDTKIYSEEAKCEFPPDLAELTKFMADALGFSDFKAEAAIANYYHLDSTLSGHVDRSEAFHEAPLFSLSFGQPAVFLIGGSSKSVKPQAILLRSGDVAVMSGESRMAFHGVPKIFQTEEEPWTSSIENTKTCKRLKLDIVETHDTDDISVDLDEFLSSYVSKSRINLNIRQVLFPGHTQLSESQAYTQQLNVS